MRLYYEGKALPMLKDPQYSYLNYIMELPVYHRLTEKDLANMVKDRSSYKPINDHLTVE